MQKELYNQFPISSKLFILRIPGKYIESSFYSKAPRLRIIETVTKWLSAPDVTFVKGQNLSVTDQITKIKILIDKKAMEQKPKTHKKWALIVFFLALFQTSFWS